MNAIAYSAAQPFWAIPPTFDAVVTPWFEVFAAFDTRGGPQSVAVSAIEHVDGEFVPNPIVLAQSIEFELPGGTAVPISFENLTDILQLSFPVRWRINKQLTPSPVGFLVFGYGQTTAVTDVVVDFPPDSAAA